MKKNVPFIKRALYLNVKNVFKSQNELSVQLTTKRNMFNNCNILDCYLC